MKVSFPERYEPGELEKTRNRIGPLPEDEICRLKNRLGGEIGVEKTAPEIEAAYTALGKTETSKGGDFFTKETISLMEEEHNFIQYTSGRKKQPYRNRVRMNFLCARPEHGIKTKGSAFFSIFSFIFPYRDRVDPRYILGMEEAFYKSVENLVISVRALLAVYRRVSPRSAEEDSQRKVSELQKGPLFSLQVVAEWNIEGLSNEISRLHAAPEKWEIESLKPVARNLFLPMARCMDIDPELQILEALQYVYGKLQGRKVSIPGAADKIDTFYKIAVEELGVVFTSVKRRNYPLLMKLSAPRFREFDEFFETEREHIKGFLHLTDEDMVSPEDAAMPEVQENQARPACDQPMEPAEAEEAADSRSAGVHLLSAMFPRSGWERLEECPDFYAYYQPIFDFPQGFELVPPRDPIMAVFVLTFVLQELFYGFRNIDFGLIRDEMENPINVKNDIHTCLDTWHLFNEEVIGKQYIPLLREYCRRLVQDIRFRGSDYGRKIVSELHWIKRYYFFPYYFFEAEQGSRPIFSEHIPRQYETVSVLKLLLACIAEELEGSDSDVLDSVKNPRLPFHFDMATITSRRFSAVLKKEGKRTDNAGLIIEVLSILDTFDSLVNNPLSVMYGTGEEGEGEKRAPDLFRSEHGEGFVPVYSVAPMDTLRVIAEEG